ncbi:MAG TPA: ribonuclease Z [Armatimonadetes bacterium]|nr:ribonuclease Z [Armatimonadota bacterium]
MRVVFLGTSSGTPTLARYLSSVAVVREGEIFLFDCGEGTQIRFRRARLRFSRLERIFISHLHGDHVTGLMGLLMSLQMAERVQPLYLHGPPGLQEYVLTCKRLLHTQFAYQLIVEEAGKAGVLCDTPEYYVECAPLEHRLFTLGFALQEKPRPGVFNVAVAQALGIPEGPLYGRLQRGETIVLEDGRTVRPEQVLGPPRPGKRIAYCPDTRPCENALALARNADLLIHEGTFGAELHAEAVRKTHATVVEAAEIAKTAGAKRLVLTHFSPRYRDLEPLRQQAAAIFPHVTVAEDLMEIEV